MTPRKKKFKPRAQKQDNHKHKAIHHQDGLPPRCPTCGLTSGYRDPKPRRT